MTITVKEPLIFKRTKYLPGSTIEISEAEYKSIFVSKEKTSLVEVADKKNTKSKTEIDNNQEVQ